MMANGRRLAPSSRSSMTRPLRHAVAVPLAQGGYRSFGVPEQHMYAAGNPNRSRFGPPRIVSSILIVVGLFILVVFIVDKLLVAPPQQTSELSGVIAHLNRHDVRRVTIPADTLTVELNDGK